MSAVITLSDDIDACRALRKEVFVQEQGVSLAEEIDDLDGECLHLLAVADGQPVGTARIHVQGDTAKIGRVCVAKSQRGTGLGKALISFAVAQAEAAGLAWAKLGSQDHAIGFYETLGFEAYGDIFDDAGIPHRNMKRAL
ncbi:MAG: GNAT family N-acetyltransferase [Sulfitobacter sp.]